MSSTDADIDALASQLFKEAGVVPAAPVDIVALARSLGLAVERHELRGVRGTLSLRADRPVIHVADSLATPHARFTVGHELGHWVLAQRSQAVADIWRRKPSLRDPERFCDRLAESLLLPHAWMRSELVRDEVELDDLVALAERASVSLAAMSVRVARLAGTRRTLLRVRRPGRCWSLRSITGYLRPGWRQTLELAASTEARLGDLSTQGSGRPVEYQGLLPLLLHHRPWYAPAQARVHPRAAILWVDLLHLVPPSLPRQMAGRSMPAAAPASTVQIG